jgi:hypothetical protein
LASVLEKSEFCARQTPIGAAPVIDQVDVQLSAWVEEALGAIKPTLLPPAAATGTPGVNLYLFELVNEPLLVSSQRPHLQPALRYLVTTTAKEPQEAHRLLGALLFAAMDHPDFEVELEPLPAAVWSALQIPPKPSFVLRVPLPRTRSRPPTPLVRQPPTLVEAALTNFYGLLLGPGGYPVAGAQVELPALNRSTRSDPRGRFQLDGVPIAPHAKQLTIQARGRTLAVLIEQTGSPSEPVGITFHLAEENKG